ncbi:sigma-54-dependent Fis family transcriptional regulator [Ancylomarina euxinus]|uniref:Sigma-54-dependent Fis family transcriptional regulator n=1 Tax=Ancylomarina euxinus TaxID=2283627 RepID=A0A425XYI2_9BACT|nr:sigma-54 dependent transcriptional regulator [Ancylomarina euxinus]MCZ4695789.1 sigma-54 dependent transcriptional regulator [Ancylomarina euxinus]MUP16148.1 response regulator [Ancylomarina euxinus]RRG19867.1 sigma-54-dependent Fis family transcriptional regulator [Ancylomarina euxinus]
MNNKLSTLILDDDPIYLKLAKSRLQKDFVVFTALCPSDAFDLLLKERIDVLICDFNLPEMTGVEVLRNVKEFHPETDVIMISGSAEDWQIKESFDSGAIDFLQKPIEYKALKISIERGKSFVSLKKKNKEIEKHYSFLSQKLNSQHSIDFVYCSESMRQVQSAMEELARDNQVPVLITGEIGLYKDSIARRIHNLSGRSAKNFIAINMASVSDAMFEKKYFGFKQSRKGRQKDEFGWFEIAKGGTLFFDEIIDLSIYQQAKLHSVLQNKSYAKIGSKAKNDVDVRLISACSDTLNGLKSKNNFRMDLLLKLNGYNLYIPPLRDRQEDIPFLMNYFIRQYSEKMRKIIRGFDPYAERKLIEYYYPGNTQELSNLIERAVMLCDGDSLNLDHFPSFVSEKEGQFSLVNSFDLALIEREVIIRALKECDYNKTQAAKLLNLSWNALYRRLQKFNIDLPEHAL